MENLDELKNENNKLKKDMFSICFENILLTQELDNLKIEVKYLTMKSEYMNDYDKDTEMIIQNHFEGLDLQNIGILHYIIQKFIEHDNKISSNLIISKIKIGKILSICKLMKEVDYNHLLKNGKGIDIIIGLLQEETNHQNKLVEDQICNDKIET